MAVVPHGSAPPAPAPMAAMPPGLNALIHFCTPGEASSSTTKFVEVEIFGAALKWSTVADHASEKYRALYDDDTKTIVRLYRMSTGHNGVAEYPVWSTHLPEECDNVPFADLTFAPTGTDVTVLDLRAELDDDGDGEATDDNGGRRRRKRNRQRSKSRDQTAAAAAPASPPRRQEKKQKTNASAPALPAPLALPAPPPAPAPSTLPPTQQPRAPAASKTLKNFLHTPMVHAPSAPPEGSCLPPLGFKQPKVKVQRTRKDGTTFYVRPKGAAFKGMTWDENFGVWKPTCN
ncbi:hypothetical protein RI054_25g104780 [Pseudoscourfieldia marina]